MKSLVGSWVGAKKSCTVIKLRKIRANRFELTLPCETRLNVVWVLLRLLSVFLTLKEKHSLWIQSSCSVKHMGGVLPCCPPLSPFHSSPPLSSLILGALRLNFQLSFSVLFQLLLSLPLNAHASLTFFAGHFVPSGSPSLAGQAHSDQRPETPCIEGRTCTL